MRGIARSIVVLALLVPAVASAESDTPPAPAPAPSAEPARAMTLAEAITLGIENNLDVEITRFDPIAAEYDYLAAWGAHEPRFSGDWKYSADETQSSSPFLNFGAAEPGILFNRGLDGGLGIGGIVPRLGWQYDVGYRGTSTQSSATFANTLDPEYEARFTAQATLPVLKGFLWGQEWVQVRTTRLGKGVAFDEFRQQLMDTVQQIEQAYWNLAARGQDLSVSRKSAETATALLAQTEAQYEVGVVSRVEVVESEAGVADREFRLIQAENAFRRAQDQLVDLVLGRELRPNSQILITNTDSPETYIEFEVDESVAADKAFANRPELSALQKQVAQQELQVKFALNQRLPQLDVVGSFGMQGISGRVPPVDPNAPPSLIPSAPPNVERRFLGADDDFFSSDKHDQWSGGLVFSIPIGNTSARATHRKAGIRLRQIKTREVRLEQVIILEVRDAVRNLRSTLQGIEAANRRVAAANEQIRAEQIRLEHGESTPFQVLQREEDLVEAERQKIVALQGYHDSVAALERAQGTILEDRGVVIEQALPLR